jgi:hypothetical protein
VKCGDGIPMHGVGGLEHEYGFLEGLLVESAALECCQELFPHGWCYLSTLLDDEDIEEGK